MKKISTKKIFPALFLMVGLTSCLKDTPNFNPDDSNNVTEFAPTFSVINDPTSTSAVSYLADLGTLVNIGDTSGFNINISYSGADQAPQDMEVVVDIDKTLFDAYNNANDEEYSMPPTSVVDISKFFPATIKIKKGEHRGQLHVGGIVLSSDYDFGEDYALPLVIKSTSVGVISGNYGKALYKLSIRNKYDGSYQYTTSSTTSLKPSQNLKVDMVTSGIASLDIKPGLLGAYTNVVTYTIDPTTNKITVNCPSLGVQSPQDTRSVYDPTTKTLTVYWKQGNGGRTFEEKFVYIGPRD